MQRNLCGGPDNLNQPSVSDTDEPDRANVSHVMSGFYFSYISEIVNYRFLLMSMWFFRRWRVLFLLMRRTCEQTLIIYTSSSHTATLAFIWSADSGHLMNVSTIFTLHSARSPSTPEKIICFFSFAASSKLSVLFGAEQLEDQLLQDGAMLPFTNSGQNCKVVQDSQTPHLCDDWLNLQKSW